MAKRRTATTKKTTAKRRSSRYVCSRCGFKAAHAAGLGRHRSAIHGTVSKRQRRTKGATGRKRPATDAQMAKRLSELERRYERLLTGLEQVLRRARSKA